MLPPKPYNSHGQGLSTHALSRQPEQWRFRAALGGLHHMLSPSLCILCTLAGMSYLASCQAPTPLCHADSQPALLARSQRVPGGRALPLERLERERDQRLRCAAVDLLVSVALRGLCVIGRQPASISC